MRPQAAYPSRWALEMKGTTWRLLPYLIPVLIAIVVFSGTFVFDLFPCNTGIDTALFAVLWPIILAHILTGLSESELTFLLTGVPYICCFFSPLLVFSLTRKQYWIAVQVVVVVLVILAFSTFQRFLEDLVRKIERT